MPTRRYLGGSAKRRGEKRNFPLRTMGLAWLFAFALFASPAICEGLTEKGSLNLLGRTISNLPLFWDNEEPYLPIGEWLRELKVAWTEQQNGVTLQRPEGISIFWGTEIVQVQRQGETVTLLPLRKRDGQWWVPLKSLAQWLGLLALISPERRQVKFVALLQSVQWCATEIGWLLQVSVSYPLLSPPRLGTLSQPDRAYVDFEGACFQVTGEKLPSEIEGRMGIRIGQFSSDPPIARLVVDAQAPLSISLVRCDRTEGGGEQWTFLLQRRGEKKPWLGSVQVAENTSDRAMVRLQGWFGTIPSLKQQGHQLVVEVPALPIFREERGEQRRASDLGRRDEGRERGEGMGGLVESVATVEMERATRIVITLRSFSQGRLRAEGEDAWLLVIEALQKPLQQRLIVVDAGHGGHDPGACSPFSPMVEKQLTLDIALRLRRLLQQAGYRVQMTREGDVYISLADRVAIANNLRADAFVSIHLNSFPRPGGQWGTEVYYWTPQSLPLAETIYRNLLALLKRKGNGVRQRRLYVVRHTTMPSVLVEACYLNHPDEERLLREEAFRERIALAIFQGIAEFFGDLRLLQRVPKD